VVSTQSVPQAVRVPAQAQAELTHDWPDGQAWWQSPQFALSFVVLTQSVPQETSGSVQPGSGASRPASTMGLSTVGLSASGMSAIGMSAMKPSTIEASGVSTGVIPQLQPATAAAAATSHASWPTKCAARRAVG
jgi:hypothetical protein